MRTATSGYEGVPGSSAKAPRDRQRGGNGVAITIGWPLLAQRAPTTTLAVVFGIPPLMFTGGLVPVVSYSLLLERTPVPVAWASADSEMTYEPPNTE